MGGPNTTTTTLLGRRKNPSPVQQARQPLTDLSAYPVLTEEVGFAPSPLAKAGAPSLGGGGASLGQIVSKAVSDVLGWKVKPGDSKGFVGALTQAFTLTEVAGHTETTWKPRSYAVQTDLAGGITGAQASLYSRGKEALNQCLPLLDGLYKLDPEAIDEDIAALKAVAKSQLTEMINEMGYLGGPRVARVNQYFSLLLGATFPSAPIPYQPLNQTDPDQVQGTLGNLRDELGLSFTKQDFVNSVEDETDLSNFRIISDYVTSLAQSWLNNLGFVLLNTTTPFFGTQLVLLSRQLSVVAESVDEVRFTLDSVFIGPAERQTVLLNFPGSSTAPIFLEDLLSWIHDFAAEEGPRLVQDGGKFGVQNTFSPVAKQLLTIVNGMPVAPSPGTILPPGFFTPRVQLSVQDLKDQLQDLVNLASPIEHVITPEPDFGLSLAVTEVMPNSVSLSSQTAAQLAKFSVQIRGSGFEFGTALPTVQIVPSANQPPGLPTIATNPVYFRSEGLLVATLNLTPLNATPPLTGVWDVTVSNPDLTVSQPLVGAFTVTS
jgi:hypothetical protein